MGGDLGVKISDLGTPIAAIERRVPFSYATVLEDVTHFTIQFSEFKTGNL